MIHLYGAYFYTEAVYKYDVRAENVDSRLFLYCIELYYTIEWRILEEYAAALQEVHLLRLRCRE